MSLYNVLPPPRHSYTTTPSHHHINNNLAPNVDHLQVQIARLNAKIPPYGQRQGYIPREPADFGDGGAFPEIHIKQYPLDLGRKDLQKSTSGVVPLRVNDKGEVQYDAILRENMRKEQIMHSKYEDLIPKDDITDDDLRKPSEEKAKETVESTRKALEKIINTQIKSVRPTHTNLKQNAPVTVRYQSGQQNSAYNSGATSRLIKIYEMPTDPLDPPKFKHKKLPPRPPSPPVPIMHSPPRQVTVEDQKNWKIPPCVSNWKNNKGFTLPLHQRLAADGRGLYNHVINDKFAKFSEALLIAERQARKEVEARAQMKMKLSKKRKMQKEKELAAMAKKAKETAKYNYFGGNKEDKSKEEEDEDEDEDDKMDKERDISDYDEDAARKYAEKKRKKGKKRKRGREDDTESESESESESDSDSEEDEQRKAYEERERIRKDRQRERKRQYRLDKKKTGKNMSVRQRERDISEKIALGEYSGKKSTESLYDRRLFNQDSGMGSGFAVDDTYNLYDKPLFGAKSRKMYRPRNMDDEIYGMDGDDILKEKSDKMKPYKGFDGADMNGRNGRNGRNKGRFEFEKDESEESESEENEVVERKKDELCDELERIGVRKERGNDKNGRNGHHKGYMYAAAGGGSIRNKDEYIPSNRDKVGFVEADKDDGDDRRLKGGLYYTEAAKKEKERRDKEKEERDRRDGRDGRGRRDGRERDLDRFGRDRYYKDRDRDRRGYGGRGGYDRKRRRSRSRSNERDRRDRKYRDSDRDRDSDRKRRRLNDNDDREDRGRWRGGDDNDSRSRSNSATR